MNQIDFSGTDVCRSVGQLSRVDLLELLQRLDYMALNVETICAVEDGNVVLKIVSQLDSIHTWAGTLPDNEIESAPVAVDILQRTFNMAGRISALSNQVGDVTDALNYVNVGSRSDSLPIISCFAHQVVQIDKQIDDRSFKQRRFHTLTRENASLEQINAAPMARGNCKSSCPCVRVPSVRITRAHIDSSWKFSTMLTHADRRLTLLTAGISDLPVAGKRLLSGKIMIEMPTVFPAPYKADSNKE
jgi:hypothetical protein